ncbi:hypothetical protein [Pseudomonas putida]|uniref:hypothetical protein n=1 Tax=Pseudomonas putida TaxID=303 RepID=UPI003D9833C7
MPEIKERPILFSAPMVRAILEGRKTVTRRALNARVLRDIGYGVQLGECHELPADGALHPNSIGYYTSFCPYGFPGDRLWVRESLGYDCEYGHYFAAGGAHGETVYLCSLFDDDVAETGYSYDGLLPERSVPSIHVHRQYSRVLLEITDVRVERLQDVSEEQATAEGLQAWRVTGDGGYSDDGESARDQFIDLWRDINGASAWAANPWVWVVEFKQVTP